MNSTGLTVPIKPQNTACFILRYYQFELTHTHTHTNYKLLTLSETLNYKTGGQHSLYSDGGALRLTQGTGRPSQPWMMETTTCGGTRCGLVQCIPTHPSSLLAWPLVLAGLKCLDRLVWNTWIGLLEMLGLAYLKPLGWLAWNTWSGLFKQLAWFAWNHWVGLLEIIRLACLKYLIGLLETFEVACSKAWIGLLETFWLSWLKHLDLLA